MNEKGWGRQLLSMHFLGVGNAHSYELGSSSCVLENDQLPLLLIDCGLGTLQAYLDHYGDLPKAVFITHAHLDHIGGLEALFYKAYFDNRSCGKIRLFMPIKLVQVVHQRIAEYPGAIAEGGANFWDCFQLIPVGERFWHQAFQFSVFPVRHHEFQSAYGVALNGAFLYTGDTRPIPEVVNAFGCHGELIFHDCGIGHNPSHTSIDEINKYYRPEQAERMVFYHYESLQAGREIEGRGYKIAAAGQRFLLRHPALSWHSGERPDVSDIKAQETNILHGKDRETGT